MKRIISILLIIIIFVGLLPTNISFAEDEHFLISVGTGSYEITVTTKTTVNDIIKVLGQPKLTTPSAFGGHAYTFYTDNNYSNYLYIETTANDEKIISYGSIDPTFKSNGSNYDGTYSIKNTWSTLGGIEISDGGKVKGTIKYNTYALINNDYSETIKLFENNYLSNPIYYQKGIAEQTITMYNATKTVEGNKTNLVFNEDYFYMNEQLKEYGSSIRNYAVKMEKTENLKFLNRMTNVGIITSSRYLLNPMQWVNNAGTPTNSDNRNIGIVDYNVDTGELYMGAMNPEMFAEKEKKRTIELTAEEKTKLEEGRKEYNKAMEYFVQDEDEGYVTQPQDEVAGSLVAGELKQSKKDGAISYINAIRVAGGLGKVTWSDEAYELAQAKATLLSYRCRNMGLEGLAHTFQKPEGVTDEYYYAAFGGEKYVKDYYPNPGLKYGENASAATYTQTVDEHITNDVINYIDDRHNAIAGNLGHRNAILYPYNSTLAMGISNYAGTMEFDEHKNPVVILSGWPSNGITFMETVYQKSSSTQFVWSARFFDKYKVTQNTSVKITCLNTNKVWNPSCYKNASVNHITWDEETLLPEAGDVYKIEISNLENKDTGALEKYTYRAVFEYADPANDDRPKPINNISIQVPETVKQNEQGVYVIPNNENTKLIAEVNENAVDNSIWWTSSNPDIISVTQNGTLKVNKISETPVTITVYSTTDHTIKDTIQVTAYEVKQIPEGYRINLKYSKYQLNNENETLTLSDEYIPASQIKWTTTNEKIATVDSNGKVTAKAGGFVYITAKTEKYGTYKCWLYVCMLRNVSDGSKVYPGDLNGDGNINSLDTASALDWGNKSSLTEDEIAIGDLSCDGVVNGIDGAMIGDLYNMNDPFKPGEYNHITKLELNKSSLIIDKGNSDKLEVTAMLLEDSSKETTDSPIITWTSSNERIATVDGIGNVTGVSGGKVIITARTSSGTRATCEVTVNGPVDYLPGDINGDGKVNIIDVGLVNDHVKNKKLLTEEQLKRADVDGNGKVNIIDVGMINDHVKNKKLLW